MFEVNSELRNWVSIFLFARGMHFPLCNLKEWTSVIYKVWADVARYYAATKSRHQTIVRSSAHQIFNKSKMHGIRQTRLTAFSHTITSCHVNIYYICPHNATLVSMRRWVFLPSERAVWNHHCGKWTRPKNGARIGRENCTFRTR